MYNAEHRIAFEYDGAQHDTFTPHYHGTQSQFQYRQLVDKLKGELCRDAGVRLVRIPWNRISLRNLDWTVQSLQHILNQHKISYRKISIQTKLPHLEPSDVRANQSP